MRTYSNKQLADADYWDSPTEQALAAELLAARERIEQMEHDLLLNQIDAEQRDAYIARAERAEAALAAATPFECFGHAELVAERDAARAEVERLKAEHAKFVSLAFASDAPAVEKLVRENADLRADRDDAMDIAKHQHQLREDMLRDWVDALGNAIGQGLSPMQATSKLRAYRERTEAALAEFGRMLKTWGYGTTALFAMFSKLGLAREAKEGNTNG